MNFHLPEKTWSEPTLSPDNFDVLYHIGLVQYFEEEYDRALATFTHCDRVTVNDEHTPASSMLKRIPSEILRISNIDWIFMTLSRLGRLEEADKLLDVIDPSLPASGNMVFI